MAKAPSIPHQVIAGYVLAGYTTREAKEHFSFRNDNIGNRRVHAAFKALGIVQPRYARPRTRDYCGRQFLQEIRFTEDELRGLKTVWQEHPEPQNGPRERGPSSA